MDTNQTGCDRLYLLGFFRSPFSVRFDFNTIVMFLLRAVIVLFAISAHELGHGLVAYKLGDKTAKSMGRLSLNPLKHLDPVGALCMLFFGFGWAKPVVINPQYFKNHKRGTALTALGGPITNFLLAFLGIIAFKIMIVARTPLNDFTYWVATFLQMFIMLNVGLGSFNLIPIPPLDGSKIFLSLLPDRLYMDIMRYEHLGWLILVFALATDVLTPVMSTIGNFIIQILSFLVGGL